MIKMQDILAAVTSAHELDTSNTRMNIFFLKQIIATQMSLTMNKDNKCLLNRKGFKKVIIFFV